MISQKREKRKGLDCFKTPKLLLDPQMDHLADRQYYATDKECGQREISNKAAHYPIPPQIFLDQTDISCMLGLNAYPAKKSNKRVHIME